MHVQQQNHAHAELMRRQHMPTLHTVMNTFGKHPDFTTAQPLSAALNDCPPAFAANAASCIAAPLASVRCLRQFGHQAHCCKRIRYAGVQ
jgi:hypothetical protein